MLEQYGGISSRRPEIYSQAEWGATARWESSMVIKNDIPADLYNFTPSHRV